MNLLRLSLNLLRRDWRAGEWRVLLIALVLAVASIATVGLFADRVRLALQQEATSLLGADLRISSTRPLPPAYRDAALQRGLRVIRMESFPSMVAAMQTGAANSRSGKAGSQGAGQQDTGGSTNVLAEIQAVEAGYPLRGKIEINDGTLHVAHGIPARGTLWADARLMQRIGCATRRRGRHRQTALAPGR